MACCARGKRSPFSANVPIVSTGCAHQERLERSVVLPREQAAAFAAFSYGTRRFRCCWHAAGRSPQFEPLRPQFAAQPSAQLAIIGGSGTASTKPDGGSNAPACLQPVGRSKSTVPRMNEPRAHATLIKRRYHGCGVISALARHRVRPIDGLRFVGVHWGEPSVVLRRRAVRG